uniref:AntA/AntB antirepressor n=1 Tax=Siphoviridae sp. ctZd434 TaxID=2825559 RepID=A0A8S5UHI6_9CAUD|nr:MAG TPA: AntA/AntB antirepressor [Siphoviridae sp. ctZd434]
MSKPIKFSRQELERLSCSEEEVALAMKYQRKLPILSENNFTTKFCVDIENLYTQLEVRTRLSKWVETNLLSNFTCEDYEISYVDSNENIVSFEGLCEYSSQKLVRNGFKKKYMITLDCAKEIAMFAGAQLHANPSLRENSAIVRKYFILIESKLREHKEWLDIRDPEKIEYRNMCSEIDSWMFRIWHKKATRSDYAVEANGINKIVTGKTSQELKLEYNCPTNELIRDYLKKDHNEELLFLERQNQVLLRMDMGYTERMNMLTKMHEVTFKDKKSQRVA